MTDLLRQLIFENLKQLLTFLFGTATALADLLKLGTGIVGIVGAILMVLAGWELWQTRKIDRQIRQLDLEERLKAAPKEEA